MKKTAFIIFDDNLIQKTISYQKFVIDIYKSCGFIKPITRAEKREHIAIISNNSYEYLVAGYSIILCGRIVVPINIQKSEDAIISELEKSDVEIILTDGSFSFNEQNNEQNLLAYMK